MPMIASAPQERGGRHPSQAGPGGAEQSIPLVNDSSSEEDASSLRRPGGGSFSPRRLSAACAVAALLGAAVLFASGSGSSKPPAASRESAVGAAVELDSEPPSSSEEQKEDGGKKMWAAFKRVRYAPKDGDASKPDAETSTKAEHPLPEAQPRVCTDGWQFAFETKLSVGSAEGNQTILESSTGALILKIEAGASGKPLLTFRVTTYDYGTVQISRQVEADKSYDVTVSKSQESICMNLCETGEQSECKNEHLCTFAPVSMPITSFQMTKPGALSWTKGPVANASGFAQINGSVPVSFILENVHFESLWDSKSDWNALVQRLQKTLAGLAGNSVMPEHVTVDPASCAPDNSKGTLFQATVLLPENEEPGFACKVQDQMLAWAKGEDVKGTAFNIAVKATTSDLSLGYGAISLAQVSIPGQVMACKAYGCRLSNHHGELPPEAKCLGGGCESTCCQPAWAEEPLPYGHGESMTSMTSAVSSLQEFTSNGTKVSFDCITDACCKLSGPHDKVPSPRRLPVGKGLKMGEDWDFSEAKTNSVFQCKEHCASDATCTGITFTDDFKCIKFREGHCTLTGSGDSKWRYPTEACQGQSTCTAIRGGGEDAEEQSVKAESASKFKMPSFTMPTITTTTTELTPWQKVLYKTNLTLNEQSKLWNKAKGEDGMDNIAKDLMVPIQTDGYNFDFKVNVTLKKGACKSPQNILTSNFGTILVRTAPEDTDKPFECKVEFKAYLLNKADSTGGCEAQTLLPLHEGGFFEISVTRDMHQCCINARPAGGLAGHFAKKFKDMGGLLAHPTCSNRTKSLDPPDFQLRPVTSLYKASSPAIKTESYVQKSGGLSLSFKVNEVSFWKLTRECDCEHSFMDAVRESIAYVAAIGLHYDNVLVALKRYGDGDGAAHHSDEFEYSMPEPSEEVSESEAKKQEKLKTLKNGSAWFNALADVEKFGKKGFGQQRRLAPLFGLQHKKGPAGDRAILVQVTLINCGTCSSEKSALLAPGTAEIIAQRIARAVGDGPDGDASTGKVSVEDISLPGTVTQCKDFQCPAYLTNLNHQLLCHGAFCTATCCKPRFCSQVKCKAPLVNTLKNAHKRCDSEEDCGEKCCERPCATYKCLGESVCPAPNSWLLTAPPAKAQEVCCQTQVPKCCSAPIAWCVACLKCQTREAYCMSCLLKWMPKGIGRRLSGPGSVETPMLPPPRSVSGNALSGGLPPMVLQSGLTPEDIMQDEREASDAIATGGASLDGELRRLSALRGDGADKARQAKDKYRRLQNSEQNELLAGMMEEVSKAQAWRLENMRPTASVKTDADDSAEMWQSTWTKVILDAHAPHHGMVAGCEGTIASPCPYYFQSIFLLHRGCDTRPYEATSVQVLTDTMHAVSCGEDGLCWVWKIASGTPRQVFFPNRNCPKDTPLGPVLTVSVLTDATFILSAGADDKEGSSGTAYIWDWRYGFEKTSQSCGGGAFLSSSPMPAWRQTVLGCATGYTTIWDWDQGASLDLPYCAQSVEDIQDAIQSRLIKYKNFHLPGIERLRAEKAMVTELAFIDMVKQVDPAIVKAVNFSISVYNFFHKNRFGAVLAVAYVPIRMRFVSGTADGKVIYWNADSGSLLKVMHGHQGRINALAPSPDKEQALSGGDDGTVRLWCLRTGVQLLLLYQPYGGPVRSLAVIPGGNKVAVGSEDGYVRIWDINTGLLLCAINTGGGSVRGLAINPSNPLGQIITANSDGYVRVFSPNSQEDAV